MRIVLTIVAVELLRLPYLKLAGAGLLLWIALQLLIPDGATTTVPGETATGLGAAIKTILIADLVMSLDNVIAVAAAAKGNTVLLIIGLAISIPAGHLRQPAAADADGALSDHHHAGRGAARLGGRRDGDQRSPVSKGVGRQPRGLPALGRAAGRRGRGGGLRQVAGARKTAARVETAPPPAAPAAAPGAAPGGGLHRVLFAVDGSENAVLAVRRLIALAASLHRPGGLEVHLAHVQRPLSGTCRASSQGRRWTTASAARRPWPGARGAHRRRAGADGAPLRRRAGPRAGRGGTGAGLRPDRDGRAGSARPPRR